jgi:hypothetical protein
MKEINVRRRPIAGLLVSTLAAVVTIGKADAATVNVDTVGELQSAVDEANSIGGDTTILIADGTYTLGGTLQIRAPGISLIGASGDRTKVIIQGDAMSPSANVGNVIHVGASDFTLSSLTVQRSRYHLIQIAGEDNADRATITDCILRDAYEQMLKVSIDPDNTAVTSDDGLVDGCRFEYTAGIGPQYYIGGIDAHGSKRWTVRNNVFVDIISPSNTVAQFAVHFWNTSADNVVERNLIINCDRGIGFGLGDRGNQRGVIRNNMIYHASNKGQFADTGIALENSPNTVIANNTVFFDNSFPWAIEYRNSGTTGAVITNNLTNKPIQQRDGASATLASNVTNASAGWFQGAAAGDLHLMPSASAAIDRGQAVNGLVDDFDGDARPVGSAVDVGADELADGPAPNPPTALIVD